MLLTEMVATGVAAGSEADAQARQQAVQPDAEAGLVTRRSSRAVPETSQRFEAAVREEG
jgi:hypothetical protein